MENSEHIARIQLDILTRLSSFERTLGYFPQTEREGFVNLGTAIDNNQKNILRVLNSISRNIISTGLIYRAVNTGEEAQEILTDITVKIRDLRSLLNLGDEDINLIPPTGQYPVSHLHTNLQIASFYLQGPEEQINQLATPTGIPDSSGTIGQQHPPYKEMKNHLSDDVDDLIWNLLGYGDDRRDNADEIIGNMLECDDDSEYLRRDDDDDDDDGFRGTNNYYYDEDYPGFDP